LSRRALWLTALVLTTALLLPATSDAADPPPKISQSRAIEIAKTDPNAIRAMRQHPDLVPSASKSDSSGDWEVGFFTGDNEVVQVVIAPVGGDILESWTGYQVAWRMARGYPGAFGRKINAPFVWIPLCAIFFFGLFDWRRPLRIAHLDLLVITAGFGLSHFFFNQGNIGLSVPLAYPALLYLLGRALWLGFHRERGGGLRPTVPISVLAILAVFLIGVRVALNVSDANVIDVGYSGVIGADRIGDGQPIYGNFPSDDGSGDTYGPVSYYAYVPFEQAMPWSGTWDDLPAGHGASVFFDLGTIAGLFLLGRTLRRGREGTALGVLLCFAWAACPYTAFSLESNTNDALVSMLLVASLLLLSSPPARGVMLALGSLTKFAPLALGPLFATYGATDGKQSLRRYARVVAPFAAAFAITGLAVMAQTLLDPGLSTFWHRTIGSQAGRDSPFSIWGQAHWLGWLQTVVKIGVAGLALLVAFRPRRRDAVTVAALGAAVLIGLQLTIDHWFYLYIPWFLPFLFVALLCRGAGTGDPASPTGAAVAAAPPKSLRAPALRS
jgi:glycosyl transferase family 87